MTACCLLLGACGGGGGAAPSPTGSTPTQPEAVPRVTPGAWVVLGSSTAAGVGATAGQGWVDRLAATQAARQVTVHNLARSGALTPQVVPIGSPAPPVGRPAPDPAINVDRALGFAPSLLILSFPSNDAASGYSGRETSANLQAVREAARPAAAATLVLGSLPRDGLPAAARAAQAESDTQLAEQFGPCFVPLHAAFAGADGRILPAYASGDGVHLNDAGHALIHQQVQAALNGGRCVRLGD